MHSSYASTCVYPSPNVSRMLRPASLLRAKSFVRLAQIILVTSPCRSSCGPSLGPRAPKYVIIVHSPLLGLTHDARTFEVFHRFYHTIPWVPRRTKPGLWSCDLLDIGILLGVQKCLTLRDAPPPSVLPVHPQTCTYSFTFGMNMPKQSSLLCYYGV